MYILDASKIQSLSSYLQSQGWLEKGDEIREVSKPGEGNMNCVLRVTSNDKSIIIKQSRGYVEKYPQIPAPQNRVLVEGAFYKRTRVNEVIKQHMPALLGMDPINNILALEDLGHASDYTHLYGMRTKLTANEIKSLAVYLTNLHHSFYKENLDDEFQNIEMRTLNHQHIFAYPFMEDNGFNLDNVQDGLQEVAGPYKSDNELKDIILNVGKLYLSKGHYLLHGDFYPGSWLKGENGLKIIDPEFCFYGPFEFDLGVMMAHLIMTRHEDHVIEDLYNHYTPRESINKSHLHWFTGIEIMRRLIGLAQLPLALDLNEKKELLRYARQLILTN